MLPGIIGSGVMQLNLVIGTQIASWQDSAVSYLYYADRVYQFPLAVVGSATGVVLLPVLLAATCAPARTRRPWAPSTAASSWCCCSPCRPPSPSWPFR